MPKNILGRFSKERRKHTVVGVFMTTLNTALLTLFVSVLGINPTIANVARPLLATQAHFALLHKFVWKSVGGSCWQKWQRFHLLKAGSTLTNQIVYAALVFLGVQYFLAYLVSITLVGIGSFDAAKKFVFVRRRDKPA